MILRNKRTNKRIQLSYVEFQIKFAKEVLSERKTQNIDIDRLDDLKKLKQFSETASGS